MNYIRPFLTTLLYILHIIHHILRCLGVIKFLTRCFDRYWRILFIAAASDDNASVLLVFFIGVFSLHADLVGNMTRDIYGDMKRAWEESDLSSSQLRVRRGRLSFGGDVNFPTGWAIHNSCPVEHVLVSLLNLQSQTIGNRPHLHRTRDLSLTPNAG